MSRRAVACTLLVLALVPLAPSALAQDQVGQTSADLTLPNLGRPVAPGSPKDNAVNVRYTWANGMTAEPTELTLSVVDEPPWLNSSFTPSTVQINNTTSSPQGTEVRIVTLTLDVAPNAPAYAEASATYKVEAEQNGVLQSAVATEDFQVTAGFRGNLEVRLTKGSNVTAWGGLVTKVPVEIENRANGPIAVEVSVVRSPANAQFRPPSEVEVPPNGGTATADLEVLVPWTVSLEGPVVLEVSSVHAQRGTPLQTVEAEFGLEGNSAVPVPGPGPWAVLGVVAAALLLRREA